MQIVVAIAISVGILACVSMLAWSCVTYGRYVEWANSRHHDRCYSRRKSDLKAFAGKRLLIAALLALAVLIIAIASKASFGYVPNPLWDALWDLLRQVLFLIHKNKQQ